MLEATRTRISFSGEVLTAAVFLASTVLVGSLIVRELRVAPRAVSTPAAAAPASASDEAVPPEAVSVPVLTFGAHEIKVGDTLTVTLSQLDSTITLAKKVVQTSPLGQREVRSYEVSGVKFILVAEPFERGAEPRLSAIYLQ